MSADRIRRLALTITTTICLLALIATFQNPSAFTVAIAGSALVAAVVYAIATSARLPEMERLLAASGAECRELARVAKLAAAEAYELDQENMALADLLAEAQLLAGHTPPALTIVRES